MQNAPYAVQTPRPNGRKRNEDFDGRLLLDQTLHDAQDFHVDIVAPTPQTAMQMVEDI